MLDLSYVPDRRESGRSALFLGGVHLYGAVVAMPMDAVATIAPVKPHGVQEALRFGRRAVEPEALLVHTMCSCSGRYSPSLASNTTSRSHVTHCQNDQDACSLCSCYIRLQVERMPSDGACLFHALAYQLCSTGYCQHGFSLRECVTDFVLRMQDFEVAGVSLRSWVECGLGIKVSTYIELLATGAIWGGAIEMAIVAHLFCVRIVVLYAPRDGCLCQIASFSPTLDSQRAVLLLLYTGTHYDALVYQGCLQHCCWGRCCPSHYIICSGRRGYWFDLASCRQTCVRSSLCAQTQRTSTNTTFYCVYQCSRCSHRYADLGEKGCVGENMNVLHIPRHRGWLLSALRGGMQDGCARGNNLLFQDPGFCPTGPIQQRAEMVKENVSREWQEHRQDVDARYAEREKRMREKKHWRYLQFFAVKAGAHVASHASLTREASIRETEGALCALAAMRPSPSWITICVVGVRGLCPRGDRAESSCTCVVPGKSYTKFTTKVARPSNNPVWNHETMPLEYDVGDSLEFTVWDNIPPGPKRLGTATLRASKFYPEGFQGELPLDRPGSHDNPSPHFAKLEVMITVQISASEQSSVGHEFFCAGCKVSICNAALFCHICGSRKENKADYFLQHKAAAKIQAMVSSRNSLLKARAVDAAVKIQRQARARQSKLAKRRARESEANAAATKVQAARRAQIARRNVEQQVKGDARRGQIFRRTKSTAPKEVTEKIAATKIQRFRRRQVARRCVHEKRWKCIACMQMHSASQKKCEACGAERLDIWQLHPRSEIGMKEGQRPRTTEQCAQCHARTCAVFLDCSNGLDYCAKCWITGCNLTLADSPLLVTIGVSKVWRQDHLIESWAACSFREHNEGADVPSSSMIQESVEEDVKWQNVSICVRRDAVGQNARESHERCCLGNPRLGEILMGRYHCTRQLGQGQFTNVFLATDTSSGRQLCLKRHRNLTVERLSDLFVIGRRLAEVDDAGMFFPRVTDAFFDIVGFTVESLIMGEDCQSIAARSPEFFSDFVNLRCLTRGVLYALVLLERAGIVHNDLRPENLMWVDPTCKSLTVRNKTAVPKGEPIVRIVEFGSACLEQSMKASSNWNFAEGGAVQIVKRAPEMMLGLPITHRGDIWGLAVSVCELLCGRVAWRGEVDTVDVVFAEWLGLCGLKDGIPPSLLQRSCTNVRAFCTPAPTHLPIRPSPRNPNLVEVLRPTRVGLRNVLGENLWQGAVDGGIAGILEASLVVDPMERPSAQMLMDSFLAPIRITIAYAKGLQSMSYENNSNSFCSCEVPGKPTTIFSTEVVPNIRNPRWNHTHEMIGYAREDSLEFSVFEKGSGSQELLGTALLAPTKFQPNGFDGELHLTPGSNSRDRVGVLCIKVRMLSMHLQQREQPCSPQLKAKTLQRASRAISPTAGASAAVRQASNTLAFGSQESGRRWRGPSGDTPVSPGSSPSRRSATNKNVKPSSMSRSV